MPKGVQVRVLFWAPFSRDESPFVRGGRRAAEIKKPAIAGGLKEESSIDPDLNKLNARGA